MLVTSNFTLDRMMRDVLYHVTLIADEPTLSFKLTCSLIVTTFDLEPNSYHPLSKVGLVCDVIRCAVCASPVCDMISEVYQVYQFRFGGPSLKHLTCNL